MGNFGGDIVNALKHFMTGGNLAASEQEMNNFIKSASGSMTPTTPTIPDSNIPRPQYTEQSPNPFPMTGQIRGADNTPRVQPPALSKIDQYLGQLRGVGKRPMPGTRPQRFANIPQQGPAGEFFRNF